MNIKNFWMMLAIALVSLCTLSCSRDDDEASNGDNNDNTTEVSTDYTATTNIKTIVLNNSYTDTKTFYQDYFNKYSFYLWGGSIRVDYVVRSGGGWAADFQSRGNAGMMDVGEISNISDISNKDNIGGNAFVNYSDGLYYLAFKPKHGYVVMFTTENNEKKFMRIYTKDYSLDSQGKLLNITVQYQLY